MSQADMFLQLDGIKGESQDTVFQDAIEILSFSWGVQNTGSAQYQLGSGQGKVQVQDLHLTKRIDKSSPSLLQASVTGKHISSGTLSIRKAGGDAALVYLTYALTNILVSSVSTGSGGAEVHESVTLNFQQFTASYFVQGEGGTSQGSGEFGWDIAANKQTASS
jgi:type VI secretion system secreted protein Hcp